MAESRQEPSPLVDLILGLLNIHLVEEAPEDVLSRAANDLGGLEIGEEDRLRAEDFFAGLIRECARGVLERRELRRLLMQAVESQGWLEYVEPQVASSSEVIEDLPSSNYIPLRRPRSTQLPPPTVPRTEAQSEAPKEDQRSATSRPREASPPVAEPKKEEEPAVKKTEPAGKKEIEKPGENKSQPPGEKEEARGGHRSAPPPSAEEEWQALVPEYYRVWDLSDRAFDAEEVFFAKIRAFRGRWGEEADEVVGRRNIRELREWIEDHNAVVKLRADRASHEENIRRREEELRKLKQQQPDKLPRPVRCYKCGEPGVKQSRKCPNLARHQAMRAERGAGPKK